MNKLALATIALAALVASATAVAASRSHILVPRNGDLVRLPSTNVGCGVLIGSKGGIFLCTRAGSHIWTAIGQAGTVILSVPADASVADVLHGQARYQTTWAGQETTAASATVASLQTQVATLTADLASAKQALAQAQSGALAALESSGLAAIMKTFMPQLAAWVNANGGSSSITTDSASGFAAYTIECDSCLPAG